MTTSKNLPPQDCLPMELESTRFAADSHARTLARRAQVQELKARGRDYGHTTPDLLANYDRESCSWKTSQRCLDGGFQEYAETWPRSGIMQNGIAYRLLTLAPLTDATGFGLSRGLGLWPTPNCSIDKTPCQVDAETALVGGKRANGAKVTARLQDAAAFWPTPCASGWKGVGPLGSKSHRKRLARGYLDATVQHREHKTGKLNPAWVEALMGFPVGWTDPGSAG